MNIIVDAMGGDFAPDSIVEGVVDAIKDFQIPVTLIGELERVKAELSKHDYPEKLIHVVHAPQVVSMDEPATASVRTKKKSSITLGIDLLKEENHDAFISAGNTGAVVAAATVKLGMLPGIERPAIGLVIPTLKGASFLIDVGANSASKPKHMLQSALMASIYARDIIKINDPKIGLINIGEEATKGSDFVKETHKLMSENVKNFIGNVEPNDIFRGKCDCLICDGFVGNIVIKVAESVMESATTLLRQEIKDSPMAMFGALLMKRRLGKVKKYADYTEYGGAPLCGVNGLVMISHGRSNAKAIKNAIRATQREVEYKLLEKFKTAVS